TDPQAAPISACDHYRKSTLLMDPTVPRNDDDTRMENLTGLKGVDMFRRETSVRFMTSIVAEVAYSQQWSIWFMLEGAPFQTERALYTDIFSGPMFASDYRTYARVGLTYKF